MPVQTHILAGLQRPGRRRIRLFLEPKLHQVPAGGRVRFRLRIDNPSHADQQVILRIEEPDEGWTAFLPLRTVPVPALSAVTLFLRVDAPAGASPGDRQTFQVLAAGAKEPERPARLDVEAVVGAAEDD